MAEPILSVENLKMHFPVYKGIFVRKEVRSIKAVDDVTLHVQRGETLGIVGESGCGKSTLGRTIIRLYTPTQGHIKICGNEVTYLEGDALRGVRHDFQMIFQDPYSSLNPRMTVFDIIAEPIRNYRLTKDAAELRAKITHLMELVGLSSRFIYKYPHEFSGGQRQRIAIARAIAIKPKIIVCDEPVSALDVSIQAQILNLLVSLQKEFNLTYLFIAHDISAVRHISNRLAVMYLGKIVEQGLTEKIFTSPAHPYTKALLSAVPIPDPRIERTRQRILLNSELIANDDRKGCLFANRCPSVMAKCREIAPHLTTLSNEQTVNCHLYP